MLFIFLWGITLLLYIFSPLVAPAMKPETWPLVFFIIVFGLFLLPAPIFYHRTRFWLLRRIVSSKCLSIRIVVYIILAGTRLLLKTGVKTLGGRISFLPQSLPVKIIITYLIRVFDTTWESKFWPLKILFLGQFFIFSC